ncbi:MAG: hypothetical protein ABMA15_23795 [Vicinamibacterales bacterium]
MKAVYWHRELPPSSADAVAEHSVEASSVRVEGTIAHRDEVWDQCYQSLMVRTEERLVQEMERLRGDCAHVLNEQVDVCHDDVSGHAWLHGRFAYMLYRLPPKSTPAV